MRIPINNLRDRLSGIIPFGIKRFLPSSSFPLRIHWLSSSRIRSIFHSRLHVPAWKRIPWTTRLVALAVTIALIFGVHPVLSSGTGEILVLLSLQ